MKDIKGYEGLYGITSCGKVWGYKRKKFLKPHIGNGGYLQVVLSKNSKMKTFRIHRLVAEAYIPNPNNYDTVDHIDGNKENNCINNLQWMTREDNISKAKSKKVLCIETNTIYKSCIEAARDLGLNPSHIAEVCRGELNKHGKLHFRYI